MKNKKAIKNILIALVLVVVGLGVYSFVAGNPDDTGTSSSSLSSLVGSGSFGQVQESNTDLANAEILRVLGNIKNISLDDDIFKNPVFRELEDSRFTIPKPVRIGRPNPFLPIGFDAVSVQVTQTQPVITNTTIDTNTTGSEFFNENQF